MQTDSLPSTLALADTWRPKPRAAGWVYDATLVLFGSVLIAASARIAIAIPPSPVPVTGQTFAVLLVGALFGGRLGAAAVLAYLIEGVVGLPVFAGGGAGAAHLLGPTGGYLLGFVPAAWLVGSLAERGWDRRPLTTAIAMTLGTTALFACGLIWLAFFVGPGRVLAAGLVPFLPGAGLKIALATAALPLGWRALRALRNEP